MHPAERYLHRELSWLSFNERVLAEAQKVTNPILERVRFLAITQTNLHEFFMVRVASHKKKIYQAVLEEYTEGKNTYKTLAAIKQQIDNFQKNAVHLWQTNLKSTLKKVGLPFVPFTSCYKSKITLTALRQYVELSILPSLTPVEINKKYRAAHLESGVFYLWVRLQSTSTHAQTRTVCIRVPKNLPGVLSLPHSKTTRYVLLHEVIRYFLFLLFPQEIIQATHFFRITRGSEPLVHEDLSTPLPSTFLSQHKTQGDAVCLEVDKKMPETAWAFLQNELSLEDDDIYPLPVVFPHDTFESFLKNINLPSHFFSPLSTRIFKEQYLFSALKKRDILLHHPFDSFSIVEKFVSEAVNDSATTAIYATFYRIGEASAIMDALLTAAQHNIEVTILIELRARFDEETNVRWAQRMKDTSIRVIHGFADYKTHCKTILIERKEKNQIVRYAHLSTGNYNAATARLYTDFGLLPANPTLTADIAKLFSSLTTYSTLPAMEKLIVAPAHLKEQLLFLLRREKKNARLGKKAIITAKMNALVDRSIIDALYDASAAGVKITLFVRGICCLRPQMPGLSENIRVMSIVGRFLEHSRVLYVHNDGQDEVYLSSADWMPRNFERRIELMFPVESAPLKQRIINEALTLSVRRDQSVYELDKNGDYRLQEFSCSHGASSSTNGGNPV
ncbi:MAG TPA: polyphosphate kinase 1 [Turneriella sp.]|nr:polyphosphate kinase 1 [Turneriella sp.]